MIRRVGANPLLNSISKMSLFCLFCWCLPIHDILGDGPVDGEEEASFAINPGLSVREGNKLFVNITSFNVMNQKEP